MKKGFTLIEMLGSIVILALIALIAFPSVLNLLNNSQDKIDSSTEELIKGAAREYVESHVNSFPKRTTNEINIKKITHLNVKDLISKGYVDSSAIKDADIINNGVVCVYDEAVQTEVVGETRIIHKYKYAYFDSKSKCV